ncbi:E1B small [Guinea pig adenovirus 1]|uniref:E1B small n=1 Tax=Guinea pig adenovirus 1 TaxID=2847100 RepID=A0AC61M0J7_9ADEN|nr:E1B small [Guinea pig adenovirus]QIZ64145.1 E1B small [Guinea pig adenovirus 1]QIZ64177.1 E1B small [Guinea pig adenovirus]
MELAEYLENFAVLRRVLYQSSDRYGDWWRWLTGYKLARLVHEVRAEHRYSFEALCGDEVLQRLLRDQGRRLEPFFHSVLDFSTAGRSVTSLAFAVHVLGALTRDGRGQPLSDDFWLDTVCVAVHRAICLTLQCHRRRSRGSRGARRREASSGSLDLADALPQPPPSPPSSTVTAQVERMQRRDSSRGMDAEGAAEAAEATAAATQRREEQVRRALRSDLSTTPRRGAF